jgi:diguanylate cyclase (GGDEF)-like protein
VIRKLKTIEPVWWLNALIATAAVVLYVAWIRHLDPILGADIGWWWVLGVMVFVTERWPVELEFRRSSHSFSLTDVPLTLAVIFTSGTHAFVAVMAGALVALLLRRAPAVKFAFNLAQFALVTSVLIIIVHVAASADPGFGWITWGAVLVASLIGSVLTTAQILAAIVLTEGEVSREQVREMFGLDYAVTLVGTATALVCAIVWIDRPEASPLLLIPTVIAFVCYRAYIQEREGHEKVKTLYEANQALSHSPEIAVALEGLLGRALEAFHAEQAEVVLFAADGGVPLRTSLGPGTSSEAMAPLDGAAATALRACAAGSDAAVALHTPFPTALAPYLHYRGVRHGMLAVLRGEDRVIGTIMLANRFGLSRGFTDDDRTLFETLAVNASTALQYDLQEQAVSELHELQDELHHLAHHDPLTGLATRPLLSRQVREALEPGTSGQVAVMVIDLDDFKAVNDTFGHPIGDELLRGVAARLANSACREDVVARLDGDAFAVLVRSPSDIERRVVELAERTVHAFDLPVTAGTELLDVGVSIGIATSRHSHTNAEALLWDANVAMYDAKEAGKRCYSVFTPAMRDSIVRHHGLKAELEHAIEHNELLVQYQPIVDLVTGKTVSVEALVRWEHPRRGRIPPLEFIPLAEDTGLIVPLGRYVLEEACTRVAGRYNDVEVQVNMSAIELEQPDLLETIAGVLERTGIAPRRLVLEVTETLLVKDAERGVETLQQLRDLGVQVSLDDFGTGYSSLSYLRNLPLDSLKIAREFVEGIAYSDHDAAFVRLIVGLAKTIGLKVVAEGIETRAQLDMLREIGCDLGQGYYFAKPMDVDANWLTPRIESARLL